MRNLGASIEVNAADFSDNCAVPKVDRCNQTWVIRTELMPNSCKNGAKVSTMDETITRRLETENELENVPPSLASQRLAYPSRVTNLPVQ